MDAKNKVMCSYFAEAREAMPKAPIHGPLGEVIANHVSKEAWDLWVEAQIKLINEERLDLSEEQAQKRLFQQMIAFLRLGEFVTLPQSRE